MAESFCFLDLPQIDERTRWFQLNKNKFLAACLAAVILGFFAGHVVKIMFPTLSDLDTFYIGFPGDMLQRMFQLISVPLILSTVITGVSQYIDAPKRVARNAVLYFGLTTLVSTALGITLVMVVKPGYVPTDIVDDYTNVHGILDLMRNLVPSNLVQACFQRFKTEELGFEGHTIEAKAGAPTNDSEVELVPHYIERTNTLGLIVCGFVFGWVLKDMGERGNAIKDALVIINEIMKYTTNFALCYFPVGVFFLVMRHSLETENWDIFYPVGVFVVVVLAGHIIHAVIFLPLVYLLVARHNPMNVLKGAAPALKTAMMTASSPASMASTIRCLEHRLGISHRVVRFALPLATDLNTDGNALYEVMAAIFVSQLNDIHLDLSQLVTLGVTSGIGTIQEIGIPSPGAATTIFVLSAVGLPGMQAGVLVVVKWLLDISNTVVNIWGNCIAMALINQLARKDMVEWERHERRGRMDSISPDDSFEDSSDNFSSG